jgi:MinD-like ATPase involved in chromosome partitioning or flagellar assembly
MAVAALVAIGAAPFESEVLAAASASGLVVVRRCVDVADLLATAATRQAGVALVSTALVGIDAEVLARLTSEQVVVVGVARPDPSSDATTLRRLGVDVVVTLDQLESLSQAVGAALERGASVPAALLDDSRTTGLRESADRARAGTVIAVWGPTGAPGRSVVAMGLAAFLADAGISTTVVDADVYGGSQAQLLGLLDESSGLLAAARAANKGSLDPERLATHARAVSPRMRVLTGLPRSDRWVELSPVLLRRVLETARSLSAVTVVDCAFCVELDEEITYDTAAPRRNGATLAALEAADRVVVVGAADPVGLGRLLRALADLAVHVPSAHPVVVVNRMRASLGWSAGEVADVVRRTSHREVDVFLPDDPVTCDRALVQGQSLAESAPGSKLGKAMHRLALVVAADLLHPEPAPRQTRPSRARTFRQRAAQQFDR